MDSESKVTPRSVVWAKYDVNDTMTHVSFGPDYAKGANAEWAESTPGFNLAITMKREIADRFEVGGHYEISFTDTPAAVTP